METKEQNEPKNKAQEATNYLSTLSATQLAQDERVGGKFIDLYNRVHGNAKGKFVYELEKFHFTRLVSDSAKLRECNKLSLYGAFLDVAVQGLSFDPSKKLAYLIPRGVNVGTKESPQWEQRAYLAISPYGELFLRQYYGQIQSADNPVIVYEGDTFEVITGKAGRIINHTAKYPRSSNRIIACFIRIIKIDGTIDFGVMDENEMARLKGYSAKQNFGKPNALYGTNADNVDAGFLIAKTVKHAFKAYPKVMLRGAYTKLESDEEQPIEIDYNLTETADEIKEERQETPPVIKSNQSTVQMTVSSTDDDNMF